MPDMLVLKGTGEAVTIFDPRELLEYVDRYMGLDVRTYMETLLHEKEALALEHEAYIDSEEMRLNSDLESYESSLEENARAFSDVLAIVDTLQIELTKPQIDKMKTKKMLQTIADTAIDQL